MKKEKKARDASRTMVLGAVMTALVVVLQLLGTTPLFGVFSTAVALVPIVIGAALCGVGVGAWLGAVFAVVVLASGGANLFFMFSVHGTIITVLAKGICCGLAAGLVYKLLARVQKYVAVVAAAVVCPVVNTGVFLLGCAVFFLNDASGIAETVGMSDSSGMAVFFALAMANFLFELGMNVVLSPVIVRLLDIAEKMKSTNKR